MSEGDVGRKKYEMWKLNKYTNRRKRIFKCLIQKQNLIIYMYTIKMIVTLSDLKLLSLLCYTACSSTDSIKGHTLLTIQEGYKTYSPSFFFTHASSVCKCGLHLLHTGVNQSSNSVAGQLNNELKPTIKLSHCIIIEISIVATLPECLF